MATAWILSYEINEYYQEGDYFIAAFKSKPRVSEIKEAIDLQAFFRGGASDALAEHILNGGGRQGTEEFWFYLKEVKLL